MPLQFTVPQFIDVEDKIIGPISVRQFSIIMIGSFLTAACYLLFTFVLFLVAGFFILGLTAVFAFYRINGQYFHYFLLNVIRTLRRPSMKIWHKHMEDEEIQRAVLAKNAPPAAAPAKFVPTVSRLRELSLIVDTGGAYGEESWEVVRQKDLL